MSGRYDFDRVIDRRGTDCLKYDGGAKFGGREDLLPMWVADMDFALPDEILKRVQERVAHGIFGYTDPGEHYGEVLENWFLRRYGWKIDRTWNTVTPGIVFAIYAAVCALTEPGDGVLLCEPVYYPFARIIRRLGREAVVSRLREDGGRYTLDYADLDEKAKRCKAIVFCSPHNPVGRVWERGELAELGRLCHRRGLWIVSDEIHADLVYPPHRHTPVASLSEELAARTITCMAPTKTFNLAGLPIAHLIVSDPALRRSLERAFSAMGQASVNLMSLAAARAAYRGGEAWLEGLLGYLRGNWELLYEAFPDGAPVRALPVEGTYLAWLDCRTLSLDGAALDKLFLERAGLWLDGGTMFGSGGEGFMRLNFACPRSVLREAVRRIEQATG